MTRALRPLPSKSDSAAYLRGLLAAKAKADAYYKGPLEYERVARNIAREIEKLMEEVNPHR